MSRFGLGRSSVALLALVVALSLAVGARGATWDATAWSEGETLDLLTEVPDEGPYWFPVWYVVIDGQLYVRLGSRAAERVEQSKTKPYLGVRIDGQEFSRVEGVAAPEMVEPVARAMGDKYWSDLFIRFFPHPLTLRLVPAAAPSP